MCDCIITDIDGVWTDGRLYYGPEGEMLKLFNTADGMAVKIARTVGIETIIVTGRQSPMVSLRADELGISAHMGVKNKLSVVTAVAAERSVSLERICCIGDDIEDIPVLTAVGFSAVPKDSPLHTMGFRADYVTANRGGDGALRDLIEYILKEDQLWEKALEKYLKELGNTR